MPQPIWFSQFVSLRLCPDGSLFRDAAGTVSLYGPGHGDLLEAIRASGTLGGSARAASRHVTVSNVDNLGARVDPVVVGAHLLAGRPLTIEVARKDGDMGGAPARVDGRMMLLEGAALPAGLRPRPIPVFNTNTAIVDVDALDAARRAHLAVRREGRRRASAPCSSSTSTTSSRRSCRRRTSSCPGTGPRGRFFPIKIPEDLERSRDALREMLAAASL